MDTTQTLILRNAKKTSVAFEENRRELIDAADDLVELGCLSETTVYRERRTYEITPKGIAALENLDPR